MIVQMCTTEGLDYFLPFQKKIVDARPTVADGISNRHYSDPVSVQAIESKSEAKLLSFKSKIDRATTPISKRGRTRMNE